MLNGYQKIERCQNGVYRDYSSKFNHEMLNMKYMKWQAFSKKVLCMM